MKKKIRVCVLDTGGYRNMTTLFYTNDKINTNPHGTIVCKIIQEICPSCEIVAIKVCDNGGTCTNELLCRGLIWCLFNNVDIINISLGLASMSIAVSETIDKLVNKGVIICSACGNNWNTYPALHPKVISVGATINGMIADFTVACDVLADGEYMYNGKIYQGTSFACAKYVGALANELMKY